MAQLGDHRKVNVLGRDLKMGDGPQDWYDAQADEPIIFFLGKMTTDNKFSEGVTSYLWIVNPFMEKGYLPYQFKSNVSSVTNSSLKG